MSGLGCFSTEAFPMFDKGTLQKLKSYTPAAERSDPMPFAELEFLYQQCLESGKAAVVTRTNRFNISEGEVFVLKDHDPNRSYALTPIERLVSLKNESSQNHVNISDEVRQLSLRSVYINAVAGVAIGAMAALQGYNTYALFQDDNLPRFEKTYREERLAQYVEQQKAEAVADISRQISEQSEGGYKDGLTISYKTHVDPETLSQSVDPLADELFSDTLSRKRAVSLSSTFGISAVSGLFLYLARKKRREVDDSDKLDALNKTSTARLDQMIAASQEFSPE